VLEQDDSGSTTAHKGMSELPRLEHTRPVISAILPMGGLKSDQQSKRIL
jgi:hypothetical protein